MKKFPIQGVFKNSTGKQIYGGEKTEIPWWLAEIAYEAYSEKNGKSQSLERLAERGGFGRDELIWLLRIDK